MRSWSEPVEVNVAITKESLLDYSKLKDNLSKNHGIILIKENYDSWVKRSETSIEEIVAIIAYYK